MPATRLLVVADSKMLAALAAGLRDGGKFDVLPVPLGDAASAQAAAGSADALALFYGAPDKPLPAALQALAPKVRERGGRVVAVLQREQTAQRDECFRAGASDLLFMPMPKDQFLARLPEGSRVRVAGAVICRQRPGTAKGFVFLTLEDETGLVNITVRPDLFESRGEVVVTSDVLEVDGILQTRGGVSVRAVDVRRPGLPPVRTVSRDFR